MHTRHTLLPHYYMPCVPTLVSACDLPLEPKARHGPLTKHKLLWAALSMAVLRQLKNKAFFKKKKSLQENDNLQEPNACPYTLYVP